MVVGMNKSLIIVVAVIILLLAGVGLYASEQAQQKKIQQEQQAMRDKQAMELKQQEEMRMKNAELTQAALQVKQTVIQLNEVNKSGESGMAILEDDNGTVKVTINLTGFTKGIAQPVHIHVGKCSGIGKVVYPLTNVVDGKSETILNVSLSDIKKQLPLAINAHQSASAIGVYTACGDLKFANVSPSVSPSSASIVTQSVSISPTPTISITTTQSSY